MKLVDGVLHFWIQKNIRIFENNLLSRIILLKAVHVPVVFVNDSSSLPEIPLSSINLVQNLLGFVLLRRVWQLLDRRHFRFYRCLHILIHLHIIIILRN